MKSRYSWDLSISQELSHTKRGTIYILADGGLGNRLAGTVGGLITADRLDLQPVICWPANNWCGAYFQDLFATHDREHNILGIRDLFHEWADRVFLIHENQIQANLRHVIGHGLAGENLVQNLGKDVVFYTARVPEHLPHDAVIDQIRNLRANKDICAAVKHFVDTHSIDQSVVGIHMRKTDNYKIDDSHWFAYVQDRPQQRFFVCSDEQATEQRFAQLPNVIVHEKTHYVEKLQDGPWRQDALTDPDGRVFPNNVNRGRESVIQAWIDLHILSWTSMASTTKKSSFAQFAKWIAESRRCQ
jgi:hypothetical protein